MFTAWYDVVQTTLAFILTKHSVTFCRPVTSQPTGWPHTVTVICLRLIAGAQ